MGIMLMLAFTILTGFNSFGQGDICSSATTLTPGTSCTYVNGDVFGNNIQFLSNGTCTGNLNDEVYFQSLPPSRP